jgi:hypothetical protein
MNLVSSCFVTKKPQTWFGVDTATPPARILREDRVVLYHPDFNRRRLNFPGSTGFFGRVAGCTAD